MRILLITAHYPPTKGGMADYAGRLCDELVKHGHSVRVITSKVASANDAGTAVATEPLGGPWTLSSFFKLKNRVTYHDPDCVLVLYTPYAFNRGGAGLPVSLLLWAVSCASRVPFIVYGHELYAAWSHSYVRAPRHAAQRTAIAILIAISVRFEVLTEARRKRLMALFPWWRRKIGSIPCPPTLDNQTFKRDWRTKRGIEKDVALISTMSLDHAEKGTRLLSSLADGLSKAGVNFRYVVIGGIAVSHPRIETWGYVSAHDAWNLIAASDLFVAPYADGVSGRRSTAQNALAAGTPVLTTSGTNTDFGIFPEDALAMVPAQDEAAFVDKAVQLLTDPSELERLGNSGKRLGELVFSWDVHIKQWEALLKYPPAPEEHA